MGQLQGQGEDDSEDLGIELVGMEPVDGDTDEVVFELDGWAARDRDTLRERLELLGVPHRWEETSLAVPAPDEAWAERVMDQVEDELSLELDDDVEQVAYDLAGWDDDARQVLVDRLADEAVAHGWDGDELFVQEIDERRVDELIDAVLDPEAEVTTGEGGQAMLSALFVAADRLRHDPDDGEGTRTLSEAATRAQASEPPYGLDRAFWSQVQDQASALSQLIDATPPDGEAIIDAAGQLRTTLRPYV